MYSINLTEKKFLFFIIALIIFGLFLNLGLRPLFADEPLRGVVAQELELNNNYIVCTINGEHYYNKPPLYNWLIILSANIFGGYNEFSVRLPMTISLLLSGLIIFLTLKKELGIKIAAISSLAYITSSRIFFYDSYLGLIDIFYSLIVYLSFWVIYYFGKKDQWWQLFILSYFLTALGVLMKGLPSIAFQGITLLTYFIYRKKFSKLFSLPHITGFFFLAFPLFLFFYAYSQYGSLETYLTTLWSESSRRTVAEKSIIESVGHIFSFPFENILYSILPWSLLIPLIFVKRIRLEIKNSQMLTLFSLFICVNIIIYWLSPETRPRYLFMLYALILPILVYAYEYTSDTHRIKRLINFLFLSLGMLLIVATPIALFFVNQEALSQIPYYLYIPFSIGGLLFCLYLYFKSPISKLIIIIGILAFVKISFSGVIIPYRNLTELQDQFKGEALMAVKVSDGYDLKVLQHAPISSGNTFYIESYRNEVLERVREEPKVGIHYIVDEGQLEKYDMVELSHFRMVWKYTTLYIAKLSD